MKRRTIDDLLWFVSNSLDAMADSDDENERRRHRVMLSDLLREIRTHFEPGKQT